MQPIGPTSLPPVAGMPANPLDAHGFALRAAAAGPDLADHLADLAGRGELGEFLQRATAAAGLAEAAPFLAERLDPALAVIREALAGLPAEQLPRTDRDALEATLELLDAHLADTAPAGPLVPGGGLQAHEDAGGHLIERHVGKSEAWLVDRVNSQNISAASSFRDLPEAEYFVSETLAEHQPGIDAWLAGEGGSRLVIDSSFDATTGISVARGEHQAEDVFSVRLVLQRSDRLDIGYRIVTGYPSKP